MFKMNQISAVLLLVVACLQLRVTWSSPAHLMARSGVRLEHTTYPGRCLGNVGQLPLQLINCESEHTLWSLNLVQNQHAFAEPVIQISPAAAGAITEARTARDLAAGSRQCIARGELTFLTSCRSATNHQLDERTLFVMEVYQETLSAGGPEKRATFKSLTPSKTGERMCLDGHSGYLIDQHPCESGDSEQQWILRVTN